MTKGGQKKATKALEALEPTGSTNLWDGLLKGFDLFLGLENEKNHDKRNSN